MEWRANIHSKGRALLMLFLFSDVSDADAPTRIRVGSHLDIARTLAPAGEAGLTMPVRLNSPEFILHRDPSCSTNVFAKLSGAWHLQNDTFTMC